jgi:hypothetical protein
LWENAKQSHNQLAEGSRLPQKQNRLCSRLKFLGLKQQEGAGEVQVHKQREQEGKQSNA